MRTSSQFKETIRSGVRAKAATLMVHVRQTQQADQPTLVGFVVPKTVGNAVVRKRLQRQLRHLVRPLLPDLVGHNLVVRVFPAARGRTSAELDVDLRTALARVVRVGAA